MRRFYPPEQVRAARAQKERVEKERGEKEKDTKEKGEKRRRRKAEKEKAEKEKAEKERAEKEKAEKEKNQKAEEERQETKSKAEKKRKEKKSRDEKKRKEKKSKDEKKRKEKKSKDEKKRKEKRSKSKEKKEKNKKSSAPGHTSYTYLGVGCCKNHHTMIAGKGGKGNDLAKCKKLCDEEKSCHGFHIAATGGCRIFKDCGKAELSEATCGAGVAGSTWKAYSKGNGKRQHCSCTQRSSLRACTANCTFDKQPAVAFKFLKICSSLLLKICSSLDQNARLLPRRYELGQWRGW